MDDLEGELRKKHKISSPLVRIELGKHLDDGDGHRRIAAERVRSALVSIQRGGDNMGGDKVVVDRLEVELKECLSSRNNLDRRIVELQGLISDVNHISVYEYRTRLNEYCKDLSFLNEGVVKFSSNIDDFRDGFNCFLVSFDRKSRFCDLFFRSKNSSVIVFSCEDYDIILDSYLHDYYDISESYDFSFVIKFKKGGEYFEKLFKDGEELESRNAIFFSFISGLRFRSVEKKYFECGINFVKILNVVKEVGGDDEVIEYEYRVVKKGKKYEISDV